MSPPTPLLFNSYWNRARTRRKCITSSPDNEQAEPFARAIARFDQENAKDPTSELVDGAPVPRELLYSRRLTDWVRKLDPHPSESLLLAARCQHICRWKVPRSRFPEGRAGYHQWKNHLKRFHADLAAKILAECGYDEAIIARVKALNLKSGFPEDPEAQTMEDALCLIFLEFQLQELAEKSESEKMVNALRKSWAKMSARARQHALKLKFAPREQNLVNQALSF